MPPAPGIADAADAAARADQSVSGSEPDLENRVEEPQLAERSAVESDDIPSVPADVTSEPAGTPVEESAPAPWGDEDLRRRIYTEVQEFVAAIARRDVNELASRYGIAGNDLAGLDGQLAGLTAPASDLTLYPVEQADDYVDGHHRLALSELEGGGVVISSELWAHDAATGARLVAHWNPMGIYPFDFRRVSM